MTKSIINNIFLFIVLVISQAVIFNNLVLFNTAVALAFIYFIIMQPITMNINTLLTLSFLLGLSVDIFQDTPGLNALCCTILAFLRKPIFHLYVPRDEDISNKPLKINTLGLATFLKYMLSMVIVYCLLYFFIEAINYSDIPRLIMRVIATILFTFVVIYAVDNLTLTPREKRL